MPNEQTPPFPTFGLRLKRLRRAMGVKQLALAQSMSVNQTTISRWEAGLQCPPGEVQQHALKALGSFSTGDTALRRLVERSSDCVHLVEEATHICLAYSPSRARDWQNSQRSLIGVSLWQFATDEIKKAEAELADSDWWSSQFPEPRSFVTSQKVHDEIVISAGGILWERLYLSDGTPARLVTGI